MNLQKLKEAESKFLAQYPGGFNHPDILEIAKKHKPEKMVKLAQESFAIEQFDQPSKIMDAMIKVITSSSMVSLFEKPKFRDVIHTMSTGEKERLNIGLREMIHGDQAFGFEWMIESLGDYKIAKWTLLTACSYYYNPTQEIFLKPTTTKNAITYFELDGLKYSSKPSYAFYKAYREQLILMKNEVGTALNIEDNAAFSGFLMMAMDGLV